jgi:large subunit ribosomal protein L25
MEQITLAASLRSEVGKGVAHKLRAAEQIPAVLYGAGKPAISLTVAMGDLEKVLRRVSGDIAFLALSVEDQPPRDALLQEMQMDNMGRKVLHLDFLELKPDQEVTLDISLEYKGQPQGVAMGGSLHVSAHKVSLRGRIADIPPSLTVDISELVSGQGLHVADLPLPAGVRPALDDNFALVSVSAPAKVEEAPAEAEADAKAVKGGKGAKGKK